MPIINSLLYPTTDTFYSNGDPRQKIFLAGEVPSPDNGHFAAFFYPMPSIFSRFFLPDSLLVHGITSLSKQCFRGPNLFFFEIRSVLHKLEQAMPLAVKNAGTLVLPGSAFLRFRLMGQHPHTPLTETPSQAAHRNRRFTVTGTR